jgi:hypothetical protein
MKKIIIAAAMLAACFAANAQEPAATTAPAAKLYKPVAGDVLAELGFFTGGVTGANVFSLPNSTFGSPQLKFRYFLQDKIAIRAGLNYSQSGTNHKINAPAGTGYAKTSNSLVGINLGLEKHFTGTGRLSTYIGADASVQIVSAGSKWNNTNDGTTYSSGDTRKVRGTDGTVNSSFGFGLRAVTGADYYFVDKVYLGAEMGWGFMAMTDGKQKVDQTVGGTSTSTTTKSDGGSFTLMPMLTAGLRIGYRF